MTSARQVVVSGGFDDIRSSDIRFLQEAARLGEVTVKLWRDEVPEFVQEPTFPFAERRYILGAIRYVQDIEGVGTEKFSGTGADFWVDPENRSSRTRERQAQDNGLEYRVIATSALEGFPTEPAPLHSAGRKAVVTGCYDWLHSGHIRFFEEAAHYGNLTVCVGNDATIAALKGPGHPQFPQDERCYIVRSIRHVWNSVISAGSGWLDADAEIRALKPGVFIVNEDGDKPCKRDYCRELGIEYHVLNRAPAEGLPQRSSSSLRGF